MNISVKDLFEYKIQAEDGDIGSVYDALFDDGEWRVRYFVVDTGGWLFGRKVLIAPVATMEPDVANKRLPVRLTKEQIKDSPDIASDPPLSREQEVAYNDYYSWPRFWEEGGNVGYGSIDGLAEAPLPASETGPALAPDKRDFALRSARHVIGHTVRQDGGGAVGEVSDFLLDGSGVSMTVPYMVVKLDGASKEVLIPTPLVKQVSFPDTEVFIDLSPEDVAAAPSYDETVRRDPLFLGTVQDYFAKRVS
jgi:hypothetical protein